MARLLIILMNALFLCAVTADMDMKFDYHVIEGKARYLENVETNLAENTVKIHTPAHNDVMESYQIQDFRQGLQMKCMPSVEQCRLRVIDRKHAADAGQVTEGFIHSWNKRDNTISSDDEKVVKEMYFINLDEVVDVNSLEGALKKFHQDYKYPVYKEKKVPQDAEILHIRNSTGNRVKRLTTSMTALDCKGDTPKWVYGMDEGQTCNHYRMCQNKKKVNSVWVLTDCEDTHITAPMMFKCLCCPWITIINLERKDQCICTKMAEL